MDERLADVLEQCLLRIDAGASLDACLAAFPAERAELEPALRAATFIRALPRPLLAASASAALEERMLGLAHQRRSQQPRSVAPQVPSIWQALLAGTLLAALLRWLGIRRAFAPQVLRLATLVATLVLALLLATSVYVLLRQPPAVPAPTAPFLPTSLPIAPTLAPTGAPTVAPTLAPTGAPAPVTPAPVTPAPAPTAIPMPIATPVPVAPVPADAGKDKDKTCNGLQLGRDNPKCTPRTKPGKGGGKK